VTTGEEQTAVEARERGTPWGVGWRSGKVGETEMTAGQAIEP